MENIIHYASINKRILKMTYTLLAPLILVPYTSLLIGNVMHYVNKNMHLFPIWKKKKLKLCYTQTHPGT